MFPRRIGFDFASGTQFCVTEHLIETECTGAEPLADPVVTHELCGYTEHVFNRSGFIH